MKEVAMRSTHAELLNLSSASGHVAMEKQLTFLILRLSEERSLGHDRHDGDCHLVNPFGIVLLSLQSPLARSSGGLQADNFTFTVVARHQCPVNGTVAFSFNNTRPSP